ncbi:alpha/beta-hydrolase [Mycena polygramma]|nr:alpha/beta-hydrolase [Mycena polygramma]
MPLANIIDLLYTCLCSSPSYQAFYAFHPLHSLIWLSMFRQVLVMDPVPPDAVLTPQKSNADTATPKKSKLFKLHTWFQGKSQPGNPNKTPQPHDQGHTRPIINAVIAKLQQDGVKSFAAVGYCFGGRHVFDLAIDKAISVAAVAHPSLLQYRDGQYRGGLEVPNDLREYAANSEAPLLINSCPVDTMFPPEAQTKADEILTGFAPGYKREHFEGCEHGFAVRGDISDPKVKAGKEGAFKATVEWFLKYL